MLIHLLDGLASASTLFLVAAGLSLIFGVTRIVNFAHGSFYMLGLYLAWTLVEWFGPGIGFWPALVLAALGVAALGTLAEVLLLRRIYHAPELFQLLATFALVLVLRDATLWLWGPQDLLGPRAPGLAGALEIGGARFPSYDLLLIVIGPLVLAALWLLLHRTRWGTLVRAATLDREMLGALGVRQAWLFTGVFALGSFLAGLGGALQLPREPASLGLDALVIGEAFVVVVVGGMGSLPGAYLAALLVALVKSACVALGSLPFPGGDLPLSSLTLVADFLVMAVVLVLRPWGLLGRPIAPHAIGDAASIAPPLQRAGRGLRLAQAGAVLALMALPLLASSHPYAPVLAVDMLTAALFAASLHLLAGPGGMSSFGHAAYFGVGAYTAALLVRHLQWPMEATLVAAPLAAAAAGAVFGWFSVRLAGVYLAMLTLAFAQITWSVAFQWDALTGGSNGLVGVWPAPWAAGKPVYFLLTLALVVLSIAALRRLLFAPLGLALRASRDAPLRAEAIGIDVTRVQWRVFVAAAASAGLAGALYAFSKGSIGPDALGVTRSIDGLVMVLLGGLHSVSGPLLGALTLTGLQDSLARSTDYWRAMLGTTMLVLVLVFPHGLAGLGRQARALSLLLRRRTAPRTTSAAARSTPQERG